MLGDISYSRIGDDDVMMIMMVTKMMMMVTKMTRMMIMMT